MYWITCELMPVDQVDAWPTKSYFIFTYFEKGRFIEARRVQLDQKALCIWIIFSL